MANKHRHEPESLESLEEGDFRRITGIGPGIENRLKLSGITTFDQLASMQANEILSALHGLVGITSDRLAEQDWIGQARRLADDLLEKQKTVQFEEAIDRQYYESFMVELLLDEQRSVRRTRIVHIKNGMKDNWAGWDPARLTGWMMDEAELSLEAQQSEEAWQQSMPHLEEPAYREPDPLSGEIAMGEIELLRPQTQEISRFFTSGESFQIRLPLDLTQTNAEPGDGLCYRARVSARELGTRRQTSLADLAGEFVAGQINDLVLPVNSLETGTYRLEIALLVYPTGVSDPDRMGLQALLEGGLVQVYALTAYSPTPVLPGG